MRRFLFVELVVLATSATALAQEPATVRAEVLTITGQPTTAPPGWTLNASDLPTTVSPTSVQAHGPGVRIITAVATTIYRPEASLTGDGTVAALVFVDATTPAIYGITLGGENGLAFLMQPGGAAAITPMRNGQVAGIGWAAAPTVSMPEAGLVRQCRIEVQVHGTKAELLVNGAVAASTTISAGELDGVPGIYAGPGALVVVGLMVRSTVPAAPGAAK